MAGASYSGLTYALLLAAAAPVIAAANFFDTIDWTPWLLLLAVGVALAWLFRQVLSTLQARLRRRAASLTAGEVPPEHAPGGWFVWVAVPTWTLGLGLALNVLLDASPLEEHASQIVAVSNGKNARVTLRDFRPGGDTLSLRRNSVPIADAEAGRPVTIAAHRGFFGWAWIASIR